MAAVEPLSCPPIGSLQLSCVCVLYIEPFCSIILQTSTFCRPPFRIPSSLRRLGCRPLQGDEEKKEYEKEDNKKELSAELETGTMCFWPIRVLVACAFSRAHGLPAFGSKVTRYALFLILAAALVYSAPPTLSPTQDGRNQRRHQP